MYYMCSDFNQIYHFFTKPFFERSRLTKQNFEVYLKSKDKNIQTLEHEFLRQTLSFPKYAPYWILHQDADMSVMSWVITKLASKYRYRIVTKMNW